jgi:hypothetical protein
MNNPRQLPRTYNWQLRVTERRTLLLIGDLTIALASLGISLFYWGTSERFMGFSAEFLQKRVPGWFYFLPLIWLILMVELYDVHRASDWGRTIRGVALAALLGLALYLALYFYYVVPPKSMLPRLGVASFLITVSVLTLLWRRLYIQVFTAPQFMRRVLLVGGGKSGEMLLKVIDGLKTKPFALIGIIDDDHRKLGKFVGSCQVIGSSEQLLRLVQENNISEIIVSITGEMLGGMFQALLDAQEVGVDIVRMPTVYEELLGRVPILVLETNWILRSFVDELRVSGFYLLIKRSLDILGGLVGTLAMVVFLPFISILTLIDDGLPIFYSQIRCGRGGQHYQIFKFRTMRRGRWAAALGARRRRARHPGRTSAAQNSPG